MNIRFKTLGLALICCLVTSPVFADGTWNSSFVFSAGYAKEQGACEGRMIDDVIPGAKCSERHSVFRFAYDYQFTPMWGIEISYGDLAKAEASGPTTSTYGGYTGAWKMKANGWAIAGTGTFPMGGGLSLLGKIGGVRAEFDESLDFFCSTCSPVGQYHIQDKDRIRTAKSGITYGLGLQYDFNKTYAVRAQYENFGKYSLTDPFWGTELKVSLAQVSTGFVFKF